MPDKDEHGNPSYAWSSPIWVKVIDSGARLRFLFRTICEKAQRFFEIARFYHYAVADGIHRVLFASASSPRIPSTSSGPVQSRVPRDFAFELPPP